MRYAIWQQGEKASREGEPLCAVQYSVFFFLSIAIAAQPLRFMWFGAFFFALTQ
jgi:hypothetical protein